MFGCASFIPNFNVRGSEWKLLVNVLYFFVSGVVIFGFLYLLCLPPTRFSLSSSVGGSGPSAGLWSVSRVQGSRMYHFLVRCSLEVLWIILCLTGMSLFVFPFSASFSAFFVCSSGCTGGSYHSNFGLLFPRLGFFDVSVIDGYPSTVV